MKSAYRARMVSTRQAPGLSIPVRASLIAFGVLALGGFGSLHVLAETTDRTFAWPIQPPATAAFLGAGYFAGLIGVLYSLWCAQWRQVRLWMIGFFVFSAVTAVATALHLAPFHFGAGGLAEVAAWAWIAVYIALPPWTLALVVGVGRHAEEALASPPGWPALMVAGLWAQALVLLGAGVALFAAPGASGWLWPWDLTPLTARAVSAWLLASATLAVIMARQQGPAFVGTPAAAYLGLPLVFGLALPRFADQVDWGRPAAAVFVALSVVMVATRLLAVAQSLRSGGGARVAP
jgi:hypothetical protein